MKMFHLSIVVLLQMVPMFLASLEDTLVALPERATFADAHKLCEQKGLKVPGVRDMDENTEMNNFAIKNKILENFWIDINDIETTGQYKDSDGNKVEFFNWGPLQPSHHWNGNIEKCVEFVPHWNGKWSDLNCVWLRRVVCVNNDECQWCRTLNN